LHPGTTNIELRPGVYSFDHKDANKIVVLTTYDELQKLPANNHLKQLFSRIILDDAHSIRDCVGKPLGEVLVRFEPPYRWCFTPTPLIEDLNDLVGLLFFLERPGWSDTFDRNTTHGGRPDGPPDVRINRFMRESGLYADHPDLEGRVGPVLDQTTTQLPSHRLLQGLLCLHGSQ